MKKLSFIFFVLFLIVALGASYAYFIEPYQITVTNITVNNDQFSSVLAGKKAVLLSDLHIRATSPDNLTKILAEINRISPDLIFLTGDYVEGRRRKASTRKAIKFLVQLQAPTGVYLSLGDADYRRFRQQLTLHLKENGPINGFTLLNNAKAEVAGWGGSKLIIYGVVPSMDNTKARQDLMAMDEGIPIIVLSHYSGIYNELPAGRNILVLSGDTHGGQIRMPNIIWQLLDYKPDPKHIYGFFGEERKLLYVTSGIGTSWFHVRLGVPPEIVVLHF